MSTQNPLGITSMDASPPSLAEVAEMARSSVLAARSAASLSLDTAGMCALASYILRGLIHKFTGMPAQICGGDGRTSGLRDRAGQWQGHYWVVAGNGQDAQIVDITADQFGWPAIVMLPRVHADGLYRAGDQAEIDEHMLAVEEWILAAAREDELDGKVGAQSNIGGA